VCYSVCWRIGGAAGDALRATLHVRRAGGDALCATPFAGGVEGVTGAGGAGRAGRARRDALCATLLDAGGGGVGR